MRTPAPGTFDPAEELPVDIDLDWDSPAPDRVAPTAPVAAPAAGTAARTRPGGDLSGLLRGSVSHRVPAQRPYAMLRLPGIDDPAPHGARLLGMCAWATALGLLGLAVAVRALVLIITDAAAWWFEPAVVSSGLVGIGLAAAAFMAVHRRRLPWLMLGAATAMLLTTITLTSSP